MDPRFSLLTFPQDFDGATLRLRILVVPRLSATWNGDPLQPVALDPGIANPPFADADLQFEARTLNGFDKFPNDGAPDFVSPLPEASGKIPDARKLFGELVTPLADRFKLSAGPPRLAPAADDKLGLNKYLPLSYRRSFLFTGPRTAGAKTDDSYHCAVKAPKGVNPAFVPTPNTVSWGQIYAYCLRHQELARRVGLIREASYPLQPHEFEHGGYLYVGLADGSDYAAEVKADGTFLKCYAARIPALKGGETRQLFAAVQFPVISSVPGPPTAPGNFDAVFIEAADYDDGFAKIVHAVQPVSQNLLAEEPDGVAPVNDIGIRLGWDDEQILIWQNRQLTPDKTVPDPTQRLDAPMGVFGYRVDARVHLEPDWHSLVEVHCRGEIRLGGITLGGPGDPPFELAVEVHPMQLDGDQANGRFWLPSYLAQWNGKSLVLPDEDAAALYKTEQQKVQPPPPPGTIPAPSGPARLGRLYEPIGLNQVPLRYGKTYELRVRLMDLTSGGPDVRAKPLHDSAAPVASVPFRRHVVFEPVRIADIPKLPDDQDPALFTRNELQVSRPLLGYPSVVFTGKYADPIPLLQAASDAAIANPPHERFGIPDPDAQRVRIEVEIRTLRMDNLLSLSGTEPYVHFYTTERAFPAIFDQARVIPLEFRDAHVLRFSDPNNIMGFTQAEIDALDQIVLPTARNIRLTIRAVADDDAAYFAPAAHVGKPIQLRVRRDAQDETGLIAPTGEADKIRGVYLQPDPVTLFDGTLTSLLFARRTPDTPAIIQRLAQEIGVEHKGMTLVGRKGERVVFGCSRRIRNTLAPDSSSITFAAKEDLINHWIVAITLKLNRDWTWDGLADTSFEIFRTRRFKADPPGDADDNGGKPIGDWEVKRVASIQSLEAPDRSQTRLIFLDAVEPKSTLKLVGDPNATRFPDLIELDYRIEPRFSVKPGADDGPEVLPHLELPVTTPPTQLPRIVSAGVALSKYKRDQTYSSTEPRRRYLWLELAEKPRDPNDTYFVRLLGYAPDPLISDDRPETGIPPEEAPLAIDPELIRVIAPDATDDGAGLTAMTAMEPGGNAGLHFLVPLPPGLNAASPELFGFFTYELRVGHAKIWSTAQGRFGRALRVTGVQHPPPTLFCTCQRSQTELTVEAPYAQAVLNGKNITADPPRTRIWALLYAQVRQADGKDYRNVLLDDRALRLIPRLRGRHFDLSGHVTVGLQNVDAPARAFTSWSQDEIMQLLGDLGLPTDSALSVLCVEMMPTTATLRQQASAGNVNNDFVTAVRQSRSGESAAGIAEAAPDVRPLSDALGHFRILRTSPLTAVPAVC
jgi:hypothetical protein